jgi:exopolyphosphatase/guanosine-5'-triphosphate,3'-diphosphate pyrophosphatase
MILAGIDIGTNTLRLLVADTGSGSFRELFSDRKITRLGQDLDRHGVLSPEAMERSFKALVAFQKIIQQQGANHTAAIGTSALRKAENSSVFLNRVQTETGLNIRVITGEEEARLTLLGVGQSLGAANGIRRNALETAFVVDIGGGSTEIIMTRPDGMPILASLPLGAVFLTDQFIKHDPPSSEDLDHVRHTVREGLDAGAGKFHPAGNTICIGTAGTITTLTAIDQGLVHYDPARINGSILTREFVDAVVQKLGESTLEDRKNIRGLEAGREDIILAGSIITQEIMHRFGFASLVVSEWGLREGIVIDLFERLQKCD